LDDVVVEKVVKDNGKTVEETVYKIEIPANRYDLLCVEGLGRALSVFLEKFVCNLDDYYVLKD
jgi:phenylalanyl-tRNA synthetase beta chain